MAEKLSEQVEVAVAGGAARVFDGLIAAKLVFLPGGTGQIPEALAGEQSDEKHGADDQRHKKCLLL